MVIVIKSKYAAAHGDSSWVQGAAIANFVLCPLVVVVVVVVVAAAVVWFEETGRGVLWHAGSRPPS